jgi:two-component system, NarL family, sensor histidine kinase UhpB
MGMVGVWSCCRISAAAGGELMALRLQLVVSIALVLTISLGLDSIAIYWHAVRKVDNEMRAAILVGEHTVSNTIAALNETANPPHWLRVMVAGFDGDRHLRVSLIAPNNAAAATSTPFVARNGAPAWFHRVVATAALNARMELPGRFAALGTIVLDVDAHNEVDEAWNDAIISLTMLAVLSSLVLGLVYWTLGRALRPLDQMAAAFARIGSGDFRPRLAEGGPLELARVCRGFNQMAWRLGDMQRRNRRLEAQLTTVQEEERAELARNLHDDIAPLLFAVSADVASIQKEDAARTSAKIGTRLEAIRETIGQMQRQVRAILGLLRPHVVTELGLVHAVDNLVAFWQKRYPSIDLETRLGSNTFGDRLDETLYRVVQEALSNAVRHGRPTLIEIDVKREPDGHVAVEVVDDGGGLRDLGYGAGFGLVGMRERVKSVGGTLTVKNREDGRGVIVSARFPRDGVVQLGYQRLPELAPK